MSEKRKDSKGRILRTGESQRKDGIYQYRYTDTRGKRQTVCSSDLKELREKEKTIQRDLDDHIDYAAGEITLAQLVERYLGLKQNLRFHTRAEYRSLLNFIKSENFCQRRIHDIRASDVKAWVIEIHGQGKSYRSIQSIRAIMKPALDMACDEDAIRKNPFEFKLSEVIENDGKERVPLTPAQQKAWLDFVRNDKVCKKYYDELIVLLGTGLRISEFCGLTKEDLDFENHRIRVERQLIKETSGMYHTAKPKSKSSYRFIPMSDQVAQSLRNIVARSKPKVETIVDGHKGFLLLTSKGAPKVSVHIQNALKRIMEKYLAAHPDESFPRVTPHVLRHTFCTNMANVGMNVKNLQYIMGHSNISITLGVYTHMGYESAAEQMLKITEGTPTTTPNTTPLAPIGM